MSGFKLVEDPSFVGREYYTDDEVVTFEEQGGVPFGFHIIDRRLEGCDWLDPAVRHEHAHAEGNEDIGDEPGDYSDYDEDDTDCDKPLFDENDDYGDYDETI